MARQAASRAPCLHLQKLQALRVCKPSQVLAIAVAALGLIIHTAGDRLTRTASPSRRLGRVTACVSRGYAQNSTLRAAPLRPAPSLSEHRYLQLAGLSAQEDLFDTTGCRCSVSVPGPLHTQTPHSRPSYATTIHGTPSCSKAQAGPTGPIALAGLVNSLHASSSRPVPRGLCLWYHDYPNGGSREACEILYAFITGCRTGQGGLTREMMRTPPC